TSNPRLGSSAASSSAHCLGECPSHPPATINAFLGMTETLRGVKPARAGLHRIGRQGANSRRACLGMPVLNRKHERGPAGFSENHRAHREEHRASRRHRAPPASSHLSTKSTKFTKDAKKTRIHLNSFLVFLRDLRVLCVRNRTCR